MCQLRTPDSRFNTLRRAVMEQPATSRQQLIQRLRAMGNKLRIDSVIATTEAGSGHPTSCLSAADLMAAVFFHAMRFDVANPHSPTNDRFVLSKGHAAPVLYAAWAEAGAFPVERLKTLRQFGSDLEGHPTPRLPRVRYGKPLNSLRIISWTTWLASSM